MKPIFFILRQKRSGMQSLLPTLIWNSSQLFEMRNRTRNLLRGDMDVTQYYSSLRKLWQEVDMFHLVSWKDPGDALLFKKLVQKDRIRFFGWFE